ncbi:MAG: hypothetical protein RBT74_07805 [Tenuifilaceae bacterium]|jgi:hypothetical protein|nr:hypothetical protein [Tenuifilaceae bacterium]
MISVNGIFDGSRVKLIGDVPIKKSYRVIVTFVEEIDEETTTVREFASQSQGLDFWVAKEEDLYQDYLDANKDK